MGNVWDTDMDKGFEWSFSGNGGVADKCGYTRIIAAHCNRSRLGKEEGISELA